MSRNFAEGDGIGFINESGKKCMIRCFECGKENYALVVLSGFCAWCRHNANVEEVSND